MARFGDDSRSRAAWALSGEQEGVVSFEQLAALGYTAEAVQHRLESGRLHRLWRGVYAVGRPDVTEHARWRAAVLACGEDAALSHASAAAAFGLRKAIGDHWCPADPIHVSVPRDRARHDGIRCPERNPMPAVELFDAIHVTTIESTLVDLAATIRPLEPLIRACNEADRLGILDHAGFVGLVESLKGRRGIRKLRLLLNLERTDSNLERRFLKLLDRAGLPKPLTQQELHGFRVDFFWPERGLVVETDGLTFHRTPAEQARDRWRDQVLTRNKLVVVRFTNAQVRLEPEEVVKTMRLLLQQR